MLGITQNASCRRYHSMSVPTRGKYITSVNEKLRYLGVHGPSPCRPFVLVVDAGTPGPSPKKAGDPQVPGVAGWIP